MCSIPFSNLTYLVFSSLLLVVTHLHPRPVSCHQLDDDACRDRQQRSNGDASGDNCCPHWQWGDESGSLERRPGIDAHKL